MDEGNPYVGAQMCNDPGFAPGGSIKANAKIGPRFEIMATQAINPGNEIILSYNLV